MIARGAMATVMLICTAKDIPVAETKLAAHQVHIDRDDQSPASKIIRVIGAPKGSPAISLVARSAHVESVVDCIGHIKWQPEFGIFERGLVWVTNAVFSRHQELPKFLHVAARERMYRDDRLSLTCKNWKSIKRRLCLLGLRASQHIRNPSQRGALRISAYPRQNVFAKQHMHSWTSTGIFELINYDYLGSIFSPSHAINFNIYRNPRAPIILHLGKLALHDQALALHFVERAALNAPLGDADASGYSGKDGNYDGRARRPVRRPVLCGLEIALGTLGICKGLYKVGNYSPPRCWPGWPLAIMGMVAVAHGTLHALMGFLTSSNRTPSLSNAAREARTNDAVKVPRFNLLVIEASVSSLNPCFFSRLANST